MARSLQVTIVESREQLERRLDAQIKATGKERLQMLYYQPRPFGFFFTCSRTCPCRRFISFSIAPASRYCL
jgi:hypothetical protein